MTFNINDLTAIAPEIALLITRRDLGKTIIRI